ncbi:DUF2147 domain-containing protein [Ruegeria arenilitoris]|uniref:DUF2147 domain-containing protein n=1 Tax=Ruegeria arenilitoris TaxID=1173585 RepID=UPI00147A2551|nr:DUF2147 domain-containing protein [Ruegeria arenilitoris]
MKIGARWYRPRQNNPVRDMALVASIALGACAQADQDTGMVSRNPSPLEGYWGLGETPNTVFLEPCKAGSEKLCGKLVVFEGDPDARDVLNPDLLSWGQKICNSVIVFDLTPSEETQIYTGRLYDPDEGEVLNLIVLVKSADVIEARAFHGASVDEAVNLVVSAVTGELPIFETISIATRASIGKKHLGKNYTWTRVEPPQHQCS